MLLDILVFLSVLYLLQMATFAVAVARAHYPCDRAYRPSVSIIIAARNEEENIARCLDSLRQLTYPSDLLEIVIVDDRSTDRTQEIVRAEAGRNRIITIVETIADHGHLRGKMNAVAQGIEASRGEILLFTDADCTVQSGWVEETVKYYTTPDVGIVAGFTSLEGDTWFGGMQALDWFALFSVAAAAIKLRFPVTAVGNNLSLRRKAYEEVGGYKNIPFSVTEDYALFHAVVAKTKYVPRFPLDPATLVRSIACASGRALYLQKKRWFTGGRGMDPKDILIFAASYALNLLLLAAATQYPMWPVVFPALGAKVIADLLICLPALCTFRRCRLLLLFPAYEIYFFLYVLIFPPIVFLGREVTWKERDYRRE